MSAPLDDPANRARVVRVMLVGSPFFVALAFSLAAIQGADARMALFLSGIVLAVSLGTALCVHLLGSASRHVFTALVMAVALLSWWLGVK